MQCYHWNRLRVVAVLAAGSDFMCLYLSLFSDFIKLLRQTWAALLGILARSSVELPSAAPCPDGDESGRARNWNQ